MPRDHEYESGHKTPKEKQQRVLVALTKARWDGMTAREMALIESPGNVSAVNGWGSAFSVLHKEEKLISALIEERDDHHVYVMPEYVKGRATWAGYTHKGKTIVIVKHCATCTCEENNDE